MSKRLTFYLVFVLIFSFVIGMSAVEASDITRPTVTGTRGAVVANHPLAAETGMEILKEGGNAVDAAVATAAALGVVEPNASGPGGDGFAFYYDSDTEELHYLNYSGRAPEELSLDLFEVEDEEGEYEIPGRGPMPALIPGAFMGWHELADRFGSKSFERLMRPSIEYAEEGYPLTPIGATIHGFAEAHFLDYEGYGAESWWGGDLEAPEAGEVVRNPNLAETYRRVAEEGIDVFYGGEIGQEMVDFVQELGGVWTIEDLENFYVEWDEPEPLEFSYRDFDLMATPLNSSGGMATGQILNVLEFYDIEEMGVNSPGYIHTLTEAVKLAAADRAEWAADPDKIDVPYEKLLSKEYAAERRNEINPYVASPEYEAGEERPGTSTLSVIDKDGDMVTMVFTLGSWWGSGVTAGETGVILNNAGNWFSEDPDSPAIPQGGVRTRWNMHMVVGFDQESEERFVLSTPGGTGIWQTIPQITTKLIDFDMNMQEAIESPRFRWALDGVLLRVEDRVDEGTISQLEEFGHDIELIDSYDWHVGGAAGLWYNPETGAIVGGADPRRDGYGVGW